MGLLLVTAGDAHNSIFSWVSHLSLQRQRSINPPSPTGHQLVCYWFRWYHHFSRIFVTIGRFIPFLLNHSRNQISEKCHHFFPSISSMDHGFSAKKYINFLWTWPFWSTGARAETDSAGSSPVQVRPMARMESMAHLLVDFRCQKTTGVHPDVTEKRQKQSGPWFGPRPLLWSSRWVRPHRRSWWSWEERLQFVVLKQ